MTDSIVLEYAYGATVSPPSGGCWRLVEQWTALALVDGAHCRKVFARWEREQTICVACETVAFGSRSCACGGRNVTTGELERLLQRLSGA